MKPRLSHEPLEEALANAFAFRRLRAECSVKTLRDFMSKQPRGYRAFESYAEPELFARGRRMLASCFIDDKNPRAAPPLEMLLDVQQRDLRYSDVPVYLLATLPAAGYAIRFVDSIARSETEESASLKRSLSKLPEHVRKKYAEALMKLETGVNHPSLNFERIRGCDTVFSIRIDVNYRLSLRRKNNKWELLRIAGHDDLYRNPGGC
jgi:hypothetical protein